MYDAAANPDQPPIPRVSYAQSMEDILLDRIFRGEIGRYMDIGANHPIVESNTHFFYLRGWRGVNVEPIPRNHALFLQYRPDDLNLAVAGSDTSGSLTFYEILIDDLTGHSTLSADVALEHRRRGFEVIEYEVPVRSVADLVREHAIEPPDLLTIDVECFEERVLRGTPLETWQPRVIVVESIHPFTHVDRYRSWEPLLTERGYLFGASNGVNRFYLRHDLADRLPRLTYPVNVLDQFEVAAVGELRAQVAELQGQLGLAETHRDFFEAEADWLRTELRNVRQSYEAALREVRAASGPEDARVA